MKKILLLVVVSSVFVFANSINIFPKYVMNYDKNTTCFIRHLKLYKNPSWVSQIVLKSGKKLYFSSPKSMFEFYLRPAKWPEFHIKSESDFKEIYVTDFLTLKPILAKGAFYVYGSDTTSPAGDDLVPFATYQEAQNFMKAHNGKRIFGFKEISQGLINWLNDAL